MIGIYVGFVVIMKVLFRDLFLIMRLTTVLIWSTLKLEMQPMMSEMVLAFKFLRV